MSLPCQNEMPVCRKTKAHTSLSPMFSSDEAWETALLMLGFVGFALLSAYLYWRTSDGRMGIRQRLCSIWQCLEEACLSGA